MDSCWSTDPVTSKLTASIPSLDCINQSAHLVVTPWHFFTFTFTNFGQPSARASIPWSDTGHPLMHSFLKAIHLEAIQMISGSPKVSLLQRARRSSFGQLLAISPMLRAVGLIPISTNSWRLGHCLATTIRPSSPIRLVFHPSIWILRRRGQRSATAARPESVHSGVFTRWRISRSAHEERAARPRSLTWSFSRWISTIPGTLSEIFSSSLSQSPEHRISFRVFRLEDPAIREAKHWPL